MPILRITGGRPLSGTVSVSGAKNAALPIMAATILAEQPVVLSRVPRLTDVVTLASVLRRLGMRVGRLDGRRVWLETIDRTAVMAPYRLVKRMRASFCVLGPLLAARGRAVVALPGGCRIGHRPVDLHLRGLAALGADINIQRGYVVATARRLTAARVDIRGPHGTTVTGTANVMTAATRAHGTTIIEGAAREPEVVDLGNFLIALGADITGLGTETIRIHGVDRLGGATYRVIPDRVEAATLLLAAAVTRGCVTVTGVTPQHLTHLLPALQAAGASLTVGNDHVRLRADARPRSVDITAIPFPGIPTDVQAQWTVLAAVAAGESRIRDDVFPARFAHLAELNRLGADARLHGSTATVRGVECLSGAQVTATDLRASAALVLAGLAADGETIVRGIGHLDRGYERLDQKLIRLGARIERVGDYSYTAKDGCRRFAEPAVGG